MNDRRGYAFGNLSKRLTSSEIRKLRVLIPNVRVSATTLSFRADPTALSFDPFVVLHDHFDAWVEVQSSGGRTLYIQLEEAALDAATVSSVASIEELVVRVPGGWRIELCRGHDEPAHDWDDPDANEWLTTLLPLVDALRGGDLRALYLGWLARALVELDDDDIEPVVPRGLGAPSRAIETLVDFLGLDPRVVGVAAATSPSMIDELRPLARWVYELDGDEKNTLLLRVIEGDLNVGPTMLKRFRDEQQWASSTTRRDESIERRSVGELRASLGPRR